MRLLGLDTRHHGSDLVARINAASVIEFLRKYLLFGYFLSVPEHTNALMEVGESVVLRLIIHSFTFLFLLKVFLKLLGPPYILA